MITRVQFAQGLLKQLRLQPTQQATNNLVSWMQAEGGNAEYNPLNTTLNLGLTGETNYNSSHVQNYPTLQAGELGEAETLKSYPQIVNSLNSPPAVFDTNVVNSEWGTKDLNPSIRPINATVASQPGGQTTPVGSIGDGASGSIKPVEWWNPFSWGNAASDVENIIFRVIAGGVGLFLMLWGIKMLLDSKGPSITNLFGGSPNSANPKSTVASDAEKAVETAGSDAEKAAEVAVAE
jgi:hypothetical protein